MKSMSTKDPKDMSTKELEDYAHTHGTSMFGTCYQVPTCYHERQKWEEARREFERRTGHKPRPYYKR